MRSPSTSSSITARNFIARKLSIGAKTKISSRVSAPSASIDKNIKPRFGAVGKHGSIAVVERLHLSMKNECTRRILVPIDKAGFSKEITLWREWYNSYRPHMTLEGKTPDEVYFCKRSANSLPRIEPRPKVHHSTPCARPRMIMAGKPGRKFCAQIAFLEGRRHLPILIVQRE